MKKSIALISVVFLLAWAGYMVADTTFSWSGAQQSGTLTYTGLALSAPTITGGTVVTGNVTASGKVSSYGYPAVVGHTNGSAEVYMTQSGTNNLLGTTQTNTFLVPFIAKPSVVWTALSGNNTNITVVTSNAFTTAGTAEDGCWIAHGRIK